MSLETRKFVRFGVAVTLIVLALGYLAYTGVQEGKSYYVNINKLHHMGDDAYKKKLRVSGNVLPGSIRTNGTNANFTLVENGETVAVVYKGVTPLPDTFKDDAQALATGYYKHDGVLYADDVQAKCASKYATQPQQEGAPAQPQSKGY